MITANNITKKFFIVALSLMTMNSCKLEAMLSNQKMTSKYNQLLTAVMSNDLKNVIFIIERLCKQLTNFEVEKLFYANWSQESSVLGFAAKQGNEKIIQLLFDFACSRIGHGWWSGPQKSALMMAVSSADPKKVAFFVDLFCKKCTNEEQRSILFDTTGCDNTALYHAVKIGNVEIVKIILNCADKLGQGIAWELIVKKNNYGQTPFTLADTLADENIKKQLKEIMLTYEPTGQVF